MENEVELETQLDKIWIENMKIHVNRPKYRRNQATDANERIGSNRFGDHHKHQAKTTKVWRRKATHLTYAQATTTNITKGRENEHQAGIEFCVEEIEKTWLSRSFIGRLHDMNKIDTLKENFFLNGLHFNM